MNVPGKFGKRNLSVSPLLNTVSYYNYHAISLAGMK